MLNARAAVVDLAATNQDRHDRARRPLLLRDILAPRMICVRDDLPLAEVAAIMAEKGVCNLPVVDVQRKPVGIVCAHDLICQLHACGYAEAYLDQGRGTLPGPRWSRLAVETLQRRDWVARDVMTSLAFVMPEDAELAQVAAVMAYEGVHAVLAIGPSEQLVGIASSLEVMRHVAAAGGFVVPPCRERYQD